MAARWLFLGHKAWFQIQWLFFFRLFFSKGLGSSSQVSNQQYRILKLLQKKKAQYKTGIFIVIVRTTHSGRRDVSIRPVLRLLGCAGPLYKVAVFEW
jgi:hypothetical protein